MGNAIPAQLERDMDGTVRFHRFRYHLGSGFVTPEDIVLDLGCGTGYGSYLLSEKAYSVYGIDFDADNIEAAEQQFKMDNLEFLQRDLEKFDLPEADVAVSFEVIEHFYQPKKFIDQLKRKIRKYIVVSVPIGQKLVIIDGDLQEVGDSTHHSAFTRDEFINMFLDDTWREFYSYQDGVTLLAVFYNNANI